MITLVAGSMQTLLSFTGAGRLVGKHLMPQSLISALTASSAFHILATQLSTVFGISSSKQPLPRLFNLYHTISYAFGTAVESFQWQSFVSCLVIISLLVIVELGGNWVLKRRFEREFPFPAVLVVTVLSSLSVWLLRLDGPVSEGGWGLKVVGTIPSGLPQPSLSFITHICRIDERTLCNEWNVLADSLLPSLVLAFFCFIYSSTITRHYSQQFGYALNMNREMFALGLANIVGPVVGQSLVVGGSLPRTAVLVKSGAHTQLASIFSALLVVCVVVWLTEALYFVPRVLLSAIIIVALRGLFNQLDKGAKIVKQCSIDSFIWLVTFIAVLVLNIELGMLVGLLTCLLKLLLNTDKEEQEEQDNVTQPLLRRLSIPVTQA